MKQYLIKIACFGGVFFAVLLVLDRFISHKVKQVNQYPGEIQVWRDIEKGIDCDLAIYGSSRAWVQYDSQILEDSTGLSTYNFGIDGHTFELQYLRHLELTENNPMPKVIVINVDVFELVDKVELYQNEQFLPFMFWDFRMYSFLKHYEGLDLEDFLIPCLRFMGRDELLAAAFNDQKTEPYRQKGFQSKDEDWGFMVTEQEDTSPINQHIDADQARLFERFIDEMNNKGVEVVLVWAPEHLEAHERIANRSEIVSYFDEISARFGVEFWDFSDESMCHDKMFFYNATHLNTRGSTKFSSMLAHRLKRYLTKTNQSAN